MSERRRGLDSSSSNWKTVQPSNSESQTNRPPTTGRRNMTESALDDVLSSSSEALLDLDDLELGEQPAALEKTLSNVIKTGEQELTLRYQGKDIAFVLEEFQPDEIMELTEPSSSNMRIIEWLNPLTLHEHIESIKERGQITPAIGYRDPETKKVIVVDGATRRVSCFHAKVPYSIMVAPTPFDSSFIKDTSVHANIHNPVSLYERALIWQESINKDESYRQFAKRIEVNQATISAAFMALKCPRKVLDVFPSPSRLGKAIYAKIASSMNELEGHEAAIDDLVEAFSLKAKELNYKSVDPVLCNTECAKAFEIAYQTVIKKHNVVVAKANKTHAIDKTFGESGSFKVAKNGKLTISSTSTDEKSIEELINLLREQYLDK